MRKSGSSSAALVVLVLAGACSFPEYQFAATDPATGTGGVVSMGNGGCVGAAGFGGAGDLTGSAGSSASSDGGSSTAGTSADQGGAGASRASVAGAGGEGGSMARPALCADFQFISEGCSCHEYEQHAYFFCATYRSFATASTYCGFDSLRLARIEDSQENGWIMSTAASQSTPLVYYWIGATAQNTPGRWRWVDGTEFWQGAADGTLLGDAFVAWRMDAPTDGATTEPDELCAYVAADGWEDTYCSDHRMYVCEAY